MKLDKAKFMYEVSRSGLSLGEVAELAGLSRATVSYAKNGKSCTEDTVMRIAEALGVAPERIIDDRNAFW